MASQLAAHDGFDRDGVARTADAAHAGRLAASDAGYFADGFLRCFAGAAGLRRSPGAMINRGTFARLAAIGSACEQFLDACAAAGSPAQVVSLGAGLDTRWWALHALGRQPRLWVEVDQEEVVRRKALAIGRDAALHGALPEGAAAASLERGAVSSAAGYQLRAADLRDVSALEAALADAGWRPAEPTLVLAECVLVYLPPEAAAAVVALFGGAPGGGALAVYEQIGPDDPFGRTMVDNLRRRNCALLGLAACPSCAAQEARARAAGYSRAEAVPVLEYYEAAVSADERRRVERLELLDELEEWRLLLSHYAVALAVRDGRGGADAPLGALSLRAPVARLFPPPPPADAARGADPAPS